MFFRLKPQKSLEWKSVGWVDESLLKERLISNVTFPLS